MPRDVGTFETGERAHSDVVKLGKQEYIDEVAAIDCELWIIDSFLRNLEPRRARTQKSTTTPPIEFRFQLFCAGDDVRQIKPKQIVTFDDVRVAFFDQTR